MQISRKLKDRNWDEKYHQQEFAYGESDGHVLDDVTCVTCSGLIQN